MKKYILIGFTVMLCLFIPACSSNNGNATIESEQPSTNLHVAPSPSSAPAATPEENDDSQSEETQPSASYLTGVEHEPKQLYIDFLSNNFEIVEYKTMGGGSHQLWSHSTQGEMRFTKQVYLNQIEGFDYPVLVLAEFTLEEDGVTINGIGGLYAYPIKDGEVTANLDRAEFDAIFRTAPESEGGGWSTRYENEILDSVVVNGENLFFLDFSRIVRLDSDMNIILDWLRES